MLSGGTTLRPYCIVDMIPTHFTHINIHIVINSSDPVDKLKDTKEPPGGGGERDGFETVETGRSDPISSKPRDPGLARASVIPTHMIDRASQGIE